jgi:hypothetical protein
VDAHFHCGILIVTGGARMITELAFVRAAL